MKEIFILQLQRFGQKALLKQKKIYLSQKIKNLNC